MYNGMTFVLDLDGQARLRELAGDGGGTAPGQAQSRRMMAAVGEAQRLWLRAGMIPKMWIGISAHSMV